MYGKQETQVLLHAVTKHTMIYTSWIQLSKRIRNHKRLLLINFEHQTHVNLYIHTVSFAPSSELHAPACTTSSNTRATHLMLSRFVAVLCLCTALATVLQSSFGVPVPTVFGESRGHEGKRSMAAAPINMLSAKVLKELEALDTLAKALRDNSEHAASEASTTTDRPSTSTRLALSQNLGEQNSPRDNMKEHTRRIKLDSPLNALDAKTTKNRSFLDFLNFSGCSDTRLPFPFSSSYGSSSGLIIQAVASALEQLLDDGYGSPHTANRPHRPNKAVKASSKIKSLFRAHNKV
jgi:hypothetical protein